MTYQAHPNNAWGIVATAPSPATSGLTLTLQSGQGARFAGITDVSLFAPLSSPAPGPAALELATLASVSGDVLTFSARGVQGTTARSVQVGDWVLVGASGKWFTDTETAITTAQGALTDEVARAEDAESSLSTAIGAKASTTALTAEVTRATDAETALGVRIDDLPAIPSGGMTGQVLAKASGTDFDTEWADPSGGGGLAIGDAVSGATHSALLGVDSSGNAISGPATASVVTGTPSGAGRVAVSIGSGSEVDFVSPGTLACRYDFRDFGGAPGRYVVDAVMASTSHTLTSSTAAFASDDIGAYVAVVTQPGGGTAVTVGAGTITAVASGTSATVSFANGTGGSVSGCFCAIGPDNTTAVADAVTAMTTGVEGGLCYVPDGLYLLAAVPESNGQQILLPTPVEPFAYGFVGQTPPPKTPWNQFDGDSLPHQTGAIFLNVGAFLSGAPASGTNILKVDTPGAGGPMIVLDRLTFRNLPGGGGAVSGVILANAMACDLDDLCVDVQAAIGALPTPADNYPFGLQLPSEDNAAWCRGGSIYVAGYGYGCVFSEHTDIKSLVLAANFSGLHPQQMLHAANFGRVGVWGHAFVIDNETGNDVFLVIDELDMEDNWGPAWSNVQGHIRDSSNKLCGKANVHHGVAGSGPDTTLTVTGAANFEVFLMTAARGTQTPPAVPAASTDLQNPFWRDCTVVVSGGSSVAITVAGQALGIGSGPVLVPSGATINLGAYTGSPAWTWTIL